MYRVGKKGQIAIFILVGLLILIGTTTFIILTEEDVRNSLGGGQERVIQEDVDTDFQPIQDFTNACLEVVTRDAVERLGRHGGYVDSSKLMANRVNPTSPGSDSIHFWPRDEDYKIAYWWHMVSEPDCHMSDSCSFETEMPPLTGPESDSVDSQIENFVDENLPVCLGGYQNFISRGFDIDILDDPSSEVVIASDDLVVSLDFPITAETDGRQQKMERFHSILDVDLRDAFQVAMNITNIQRSQALFETQLLEMISLYSGTGPDAILPPSYTSLTNRYDQRKFSWTRTEIRQSLMSMLSSYVPMFSVREANNHRLANVDAGHDVAFFDKMVMSIGDIPDTSRYDINFDYKSWWDLYLDIGDSEMVKPDEMSVPGMGDIPIVGPIMNQFMPVDYQFTYDVSYPVLVSVFDNDAFGGDGFTMNFALESNLRSNMPARGGSGASMPSGSSIGGSRFCRPEHRTTEPIKIEVVDSATGEPISGAALEYTCGRDTCYVGNTEEQEDGVYYMEPFPTCIGGRLHISAKDYGSKVIDMTTTEGETVDLPEFELDPIVDVEVEVKVIGTFKVDGSWQVDFDREFDLREAESVLLNIDKVSEDSSADDFSSVAFLDGGDTDTELRLIPGEYEVNAQLTLDTTHDDIPSVVIPEEERNEPTGLFNIGSETVVLPEIPFDDYFPQGMLMLDESHGGNWVVTADELSSAEKVTFYIIASPYVPVSGVDMNYDDLDQIGKSDYYSRQYRSLIDPEFE